MRKIYLIAAMLLSVAATAQQRTFTKSVSVNYATQQVTLNISWAAGSRGASGVSIYKSKVWVLVDYQEVRNGVPYGSWQRATIDLSKLPANCTADGTNTKGFWYQGQASAVQNANVTVTLTNVPAQFKWCAFASDREPDITASGGVYTFHGTPPFTLIAANGVTKQVVVGRTLAATALTIAPKMVTDKTDCPGMFCPYTDNDLYIDATHSCRLRTGGAQNWEAWIQDVRDNKIYRIVQMPDGRWWMADNLDYRGSNYCCYQNVAENCSLYGALYTSNPSPTNACPTNWVIPDVNIINNLKTNIGATVAKDIASTTRGGNDRYGFNADASRTWHTSGGGGYVDFWAQGYINYLARGTDRDWRIYTSNWSMQEEAMTGSSSYWYYLPVRCLR